MTLPAGATAERSNEVMNRIEDYFFDNEAENVESAFWCSDLASPAADKTAASCLFACTTGMS